ncbi:AbiJ-NTD4 domain-containing protein [Achromobacter xylosoxidans]|uniref:HEPN AbiJ-N-terminal domain-containing protein n=1 Tax=Achromobacter xylosoxidans (strain A8) TaxID=762376 RepID=E3HGQ4_ACHXA|nr:hypothetical protein [Achromobacter xylosoxidans]ADP15390.1 hypothetical protein AXYL_02061 [Achromobacter xylosoxidans A8]
MATFSERRGLVPVQDAFQRNSVDTPLRTRLWNFLASTVFAYHHPEECLDGICGDIWIFLLNQDRDTLPPFFLASTWPSDGYRVMKAHFFSCPWNEVYDILEFIYVSGRGLDRDVGHRKTINVILERHQSAYRLIGDQVGEITQGEEIAAIENALLVASNPVKQHLDEALKKLSDREQPDFRNSIKESVSAVEAACREVTGNPKATLQDALKKMDSLHPALNEGFRKLYAYAGDESGIRHALTEEGERCSYGEAKFMLVACAAFVSYLKEATA